MSGAKDTVKLALFNEALRVGTKSADQAQKQMQINRAAVDAIQEALVLLKSGRAREARERLETGLVAVTRLSAP